MEERFFVRIDKQKLKDWKKVPSKDVDYTILNPVIAAGDCSYIHLSKEEAKEGKKDPELITMKVMCTSWFRENKEALDKMISHTNTLSAIEVTPGMMRKHKRTAYMISKNFIYFPLEMCNCGSLEFQVQEKDGRFDEDKIREVLKGVLGVLGKMHNANYLHRRLDPSHILVHENSDGSIAYKLVGMQYVLSLADQSKSFNVVLSPAYSAPEMQDCVQCSFSSDVWSLGIVLYFMAVGSPPSAFDALFVNKIKAGENIYPPNTKVSSELKDLIKNCLAFRPEQRINLNEIMYHPFTLGKKLSEEMPWRLEESGESSGLDPDKIRVKTRLDLAGAIKDVLDYRRKDPSETVDEEKEFRIVTRDSLDPYVPYDREKDERPFSNGAFSCVYLCRNKRSQEDVKLVRKEIITSKYRELHMLKQLISEVEIMQTLQDSAFTLSLVDYFFCENRLNLILEYCNGGTLEDYVIELKDNRQEVGLDELSLIAWSLACGLNDMHQLNIMHRDIKAENVLLVKDTEGKDGKVIDVKLADYGLGKRADMEDILAGSTAAGTPRYFAPEIHDLRGRLQRGDEPLKPYNEKVDVWSYGVLLYFVVFGKTPAENSRMLSVIMKERAVSSYPPYSPKYEDYMKLVRRCLEFDPDKRPSFREILKDRFFEEVYIRKATKLYPYALGRRIAKGYKTEVYEARRQGKVFAVKAIDMKGQEKKMKQIKEEVRTQARLSNSANAVRLYDYFEHDTKLYLAMKYYSGGDLQHFVFEQEKKYRPLDVHQQVFVAREVLRALSDMHARNVIHRDVCPRNVVLATDSKRNAIKELALCDYGFAKVLLGDEETNTVIGTYKSPELAFPQFGQQYNSMTDIWSFGMLLYFVMFGFHIYDLPGFALPTADKELVFNWEADAAKRPAISKELYTIMARCLKFKPNERPTAAQLLKESIFGK